MKNKEYTIDAAQKTIGRVASQAAKTLMGKVTADYEPRIDSVVRVHIANAAKLLVSDRKKLQKRYTSFSGYPGGQRIESLANLMARKGNGEVLRKAIQRMLPNNTMRPNRMKRLTISD